MALKTGGNLTEINQTVVQVGHGDIQVGSGKFLFNAQFERSGGDLIISGADGVKMVVVGYFKSAAPANLLSDNGAMLSGELVEILAGPLAPGQYAQTTDTQTGPAQIGIVVGTTGNVAATRPDGTSVSLTEGTPVFSGDVVITAAGSTVSMAFLDGTVFNMAESGRMVLNNLVYEQGGSNNSMLFSIVQGGFAFFAGQIAPTGDMQVNTPVALLGVRGTSPTVLSAADGVTALSIVPDPGTLNIGSYTAFNPLNNQPVATINDPAITVIINAAGADPQIISKSAADIAADQIIQQQLTDAFNRAQPLIQQLQEDLSGPDGGQTPDRRGDLIDGTQFATSADTPGGTGNSQPPSDIPIPGAGPFAPLVPSSGINSGDIAKAQQEDILQTQPTTVNSFTQLAPRTAVTQTTTNLLRETDDGAASSSSSNDGPATTLPPTGTPGATLTIALPDAPTIFEDVPIILQGFDIRSSTDTILQVQITVRSTVTLATTNGLTFSIGDGVDDEFLTFQGTAENINNALNGLTYNPTPNNDVVGGIDIDVASGDAEAAATLTINITAVNDAPNAVDDTAVVIEDGLLSSVAVLANDTDIDGDALTVVEATASNGTVSINADGTLSYAPVVNFFGTDAITYKIDDGNGATDTATVTVTVTSVNDDPIADNETATTNEDTPLVNIDVLTGDIDPDGDTLTVTNASADDGTVTINADGTLNYTPDADFNGLDTIRYTVDDGNGGTDFGFVAVTVNPINDAPVADDETAATDPNTPINNIDVLTGDTDVDGDVLSVTQASAVRGSVTINTDGTLNYVPNSDFVGIDTVTYTVSDGNGGTDTGIVTVTISSPGNNPPVADDETATTNEDTALTNIDVLTGDIDPDNDPLTVTLAVADNGTVTINTDGTLNYSPVANFNGTDTITYTIDDGNGGTDTGIVTVTVTPVNDDPIAADITGSTDEDTALDNIDVVTVSTDVDGDVLSVLTASAPNGSILFNSDDTFNYTPNAGFVGTDIVTYTIIDGNGGTDEGTVTITVTAAGNNPPVADDETVATNEDTPLINIDVLTGDIDPDGDPLTVTLATANNGAVTINPDGTLNYSPETNFNGTDTITYTIDDSNGGTDTGTVTVNVAPINDDPIADDETATTDQDTPINNIDVLTGDIDPDGDTLTVTLASAGNGTVSINTNGTLNYSPNTSFNGVDTITYTIDDGNGGTDTGTVTVTVNAAGNNPPVADDEIVSTNEDTPLFNIDVLTGDIDPDGDPLTVTLATANNGAVTINTDGTLNYTPNADFNGVDSITYTIDDGNGGTDTGTVTVNISPVNDAPVADDETATTNEDTLLSNIDVLTGDTDVDGDTLTVTLASAGNGSVSINSDSSLNYTPDANFNGLDTITYTVSDGNGGTDTGSVLVTVNPVNDAPVADDEANITPQATPLVVTGAPNQDPNNLLTGDIDPDGDNLQITTFQVAGISTVFAAGTTANIDAVGFLTISATGTYSFIPSPNFTGVVPLITYTVADDNAAGALTDTGNLTLTVVPTSQLITIDQQRSSVFSDTFDFAFFEVLIDGTLLSYGVTTIGTPTSTSFTVENVVSASRVTEFIGTNFTFNANGDVTGGTIDQIAFTQTNFIAGPITIAIASGLALPAVDFFDALALAPTDNEAALDALFAPFQFNYLGSDGPFGDEFTGGMNTDIIFGNAGDDILEGDGGSDVIDGGDGDDNLMGNEGNDILIGGDGRDTLDGGAGNDTADYSEAPGGINVFIGEMIEINDGYGNFGDLFGIENIVGSDFDDLIIGGGTNVLFGGGGNDEIDAGFGNDILIGGLGRDNLTGGRGADIFSIDELEVGISDIITDYNLAEGDIVDLTELFEVDGDNSTATTNDDNLSDFVRIEPANLSGLDVDANGLDGGVNFQSVAQLNGISGVRILYNEDGVETTTII